MPTEKTVERLAPLLKRIKAVLDAFEQGKRLEIKVEKLREIHDHFDKHVCKVAHVVPKPPTAKAKRPK